MLHHGKFIVYQWEIKYRGRVKRIGCLEVIQIEDLSLALDYLSCGCSYLAQLSK